MRMGCGEIVRYLMICLYARLELITDSSDLTKIYLKLNWLILSAFTYLLDKVNKSKHNLNLNLIFAKNNSIKLFLPKRDLSDLIYHLSLSLPLHTLKFPNYSICPRMWYVNPRNQGCELWCNRSGPYAFTLRLMQVYIPHCHSKVHKSFKWTQQSVCLNASFRYPAT